MKPEDAECPRDRIREGSLKVIYTSPDDEWSLAEMIFDDEPRIGCRGNGDIHDPDDKGNPRSHNHATWFILPGPIGDPIGSLAKTFAKAYG